MFISYQSVRNSVVAGVLGLAGLGIYWTSSGDGGRSLSSDAPAVAPNSPPVGSPLLSPVGMDSAPSDVAPPSQGDSDASPPTPATPSPAAVAEVTELTGSTTDQASATPPAAAADNLLAQAMQIALAPARPKGGKDVLGSGSPWKLNLYDDNRDGRWDRGKLDTNRDEIDDEKWNFKDGRWEKDGGALVWSDGAWRPAAGVEPSATTSASSQGNPGAVTAAQEAPTAAGSPGTSTAAPDAQLERYRAAMKIATSPAVPGKGKDILGSQHPWKLNLYDDNHDGQWDRGKLDTNRDEVDDEKWNFKKGRWEKDGGAKIWNGSDWVNE